MRDTKIVNIDPAPQEKPPYWRIILLAVVVFFIIGMVIKNRKETVPVTNSNTETKPTNGIPPDSLHH